MGVIVAWEADSTLGHAQIAFCSQQKEENPLKTQT